MSKILVLSEAGSVDENLNAALENAGYEISLDDGSGQLDEYELVLAPPSYFSVPKTSGGSEDYAAKLYELFPVHDGELTQYLEAMKNEIYAAVSDAAQADRLISRICRNVIDKVFTENEWLELYLLQEDFAVSGAAEAAERLLMLQREYNALYPTAGGDEDEVILYILNNPESDIRQKTLASKMYINSSYLSTVFAAKTGGRFVDYLTTVKLKRAAYLLMNSTLRVSEIAARLDYKDIGYFSRMFKARYGMPPSEYRMPQNYIYII